MPLQFVKSQKGANHLIHDGYRFVKDGSGLNKIIWKCSEYKVCGFKGRVHTSDGEVIFHSDNHSCTPNLTKIVVKEVLSELKKIASECSENPTRIISRCTENLPVQITAALPSTRAMTKKIQYQKKTDQPPASPDGLVNLNIPDAYKKTKRGEPFLVHDSGPGEDRILIFSTERNLQFLQNSSRIFGDGTVKTAPLIFEQIYTTHGILDNQVFPLVFTLMKRKTTDAYLGMVNAIKRLIPAWNPAIITTDFESAAISAFGQAFPNSRHHGCHFNFGQRIWKRIQKHPAVASRYRSDADFAVNVKCLSALAFVPPDEVEGKFRILARWDFFRDNRALLPILEYFERTCIGYENHLTGIRHAPKFRIETWNCYQLVLQGEQLTTNSLEGWHRQFYSRVSCCHSSIWKCIDALKLEQNLVHLKLDEFARGRNPKPPSLLYQSIAKNIHTAVTRYARVDIFNYLTGLAHNIEFNV